MTDMQVNAPRRALLPRAKNGRIFRFTVVSLARSLINLWKDPRQMYPRLTDRQARDVGLDPADLEWSKLELPSHSTRHPML